MKQGSCIAGRFSSATTDFTLRLSFLVILAMFLAPPVRADVFSLTDNTMETSGGTPGGDLLALNHFDTAGRTVAINEISVAWGPLSSAMSPTVALYSDPNGDGNPADAELVMSYPIYIPGGVVILSGSSYQSYTIPTTVVAGSFFVGAYVSDRDGGFTPSVSVDTSHPQPSQSWIIENTSVGGLDLESPAASSTLVAPLNNYINGNHMIRATYSVLPGPFCTQAPVGLASWWRADGNALDALAHNHGALLGDATVGAGYGGQAFVFDGDRDGVQIGDATNLQLQDFTIEAWVKRANATNVSFNGDGSGLIFSLGTTGGYGFGLNADGFLMLASLQINEVMSDARIADTNWHHVAVTKFQTNVVFYLDGVPHPAPAYDSGGFVFAAPGYIGAREQAGILENSFYGAIDEVAVYGRPLSAVEVQQIFAADVAGKCPLPPGGPPIITSQPQDQLKSPGGIVTFAVIAEGASPLAYQWFRSGNALTGKTNSGLTLTNVQTNQAGYYSVTVSNAFGMTTSSNALLTVSTLPPPVCLPLPNGAVAWWRAQSNTVDSVGLNDGYWDSLPFGAVSTYGAGKSGAAFRFLSKIILPGRDSSSTGITIPASQELDLGAGVGLTAECWILPTSLSGVRPLVEWNDNQGNIGFGLALHDSTVEATLTDTNGAAPRRFLLRSSSGNLVTSNWQHVAVTYNRTGGVFAAYLNGVLVARTNLGSLTPQTRTPVFLAHRPSGTYAQSSYAGSLDEVTLYNRALTAEELQEIVMADSAGKCPPPPPACLPLPSGCVAWWRGETNALDSVANSHGSVVGSVSYGVGIVGRAMGFQIGYVRVPASSNLNVGVATGLTAEAWISPAFGGSVSLASKREFVSWRSGALVGVNLSVTNFTVGRTGDLTAWLADLVDTQGVHHVLRALPVVGPNQWQHVALTYDKTTGNAVLYVGGMPVTQTNLGTFTPNTSGDLYLGYQTSIDPHLSVGGAMDELTLYQRALTPEEIKAIVMTRSTGKCKSPPTFVAQPFSQRVNLGADAQFEVVASGNALLRYQWFKNSTVLPSATNASLRLPVAQDSQAGNYTVRVTNWFGSALSSSAVLMINHAPTADASATILKAISPNNQDAGIVLDGSRSSDPDHDPLQFRWYEVGAESAVATGMVTTVALPIGDNSITLVVDDGLATSSQTITVQVLSAAQATEQLLALVQNLSPERRPLAATLSAALAAMDRNNPTAALNDLLAFQNKVRSQVIPTDPELAELLLEKSQELINALSGETKARGHFTNIERNASGRVQLQFSAFPASVYVVEASTNLVDWETVRSVQSDSMGNLNFEDRESARLPFRYYRIKEP